APGRSFLLAGGDAERARLRDRAVGGVLFGMARLLDPEGIERLDPAAELDRLLRRARDRPSGVHQQGAVLPQRGPRGGEERDVPGGVLAEAAPAELDGLESLVVVFPRGIGHLPRRLAEQRARVRGDAVAPRAPKERVDRLAERLAHDVVAGEVDPADRLEDDAAAAVVDGAGIEAV